mgnify:CR=1 FL=1
MGSTIRPATVMREGEGLGSHFHSASIVSGAYYSGVPDGSSPLVLLVM